MLLLIGTMERIMKYSERGMEAAKTGKGIQVKIKAQSKSSSGLAQSLGVAHTENISSMHTDSIFYIIYMH
jgi:hypothetical protein